MITFNKGYFSVAVLIFVIEVLIALFVTDHFIRPYAGDVLVVILLYCFVQSFFRWHFITVALFVLLFSFAVEFLQYIHIIDKLGLQHSRIARTVMGTTFVWNDFVAYIAGVTIVVVVEKYGLGKEL
jgi:hypothetical protein